MAEPSSYPRILILGESFSNITGGGITLSNLFKGWPKDKLAVVHDMRFYPNTAVCDQYYRLGSSEWSFVWPFSLALKNNRVSGEVQLDETELEDAEISKEKNEIWQKETRVTYQQNALRRLLTFVDNKVGGEAIIRRLTLSNELAGWIKRFQPELIYTQLSTIQLIRMTRQFHEAFQIPYVIHIMDDWPTTLYSDKLLAPYLRSQLNKEFTELLACASGFFGISQKMCDCYQQRYSYPCTPFHNPIDLEMWLQQSKQDWAAHTPFRIMYRGHLGMGIQKSLADLRDAVVELNQAGRPVRLDITLTPSCDEEMRQTFERPGCVFINEIIPYKEVPKALADADLLILAYDFDDEAININRYSMPTRATEFMVSGTPVLIYGPGELAVSEYARRENWGATVDERSQPRLVETLIKLIDNQRLREALGTRAREVAIQKHDAAHVREAFRQALLAASKQPPKKR